MQDLYVGMPLFDVIELTESIDILSPFKDNILNFCRQELEFGDSKISNEIELAMLTAWLNNSDKISMPQLLSDKYKLTDMYSEEKDHETRIYEEFISSDNTYYLRCITKNTDDVVTKVTLTHRDTSFIDIIKNGGTEDFLTDYDNDGFANSRTVIKKRNGKLDMFNDINLDGKKD